MNKCLSELLQVDTLKLVAAQTKDESNTEQNKTTSKPKTWLDCVWSVGL